MTENFRERADLTKIIKSILDSYPLGNGILRELLQNSDDASATKQTFILDMRTHPSDSVVDQDLIGCQGPALLAVNDTLFSESDWQAIRTLHSSSKTADETKTGKFGIGVRAIYHITDNPHFLSGNKLVIFDPHERFSGNNTGGVRIDVPTEGKTRYPDQLAAFDKSLSPTADGFYPGTVVRLPLRTVAQASASTIKPTAVDQSVIRTLFDDFVEKELSVVMMFLKHIRYICLKVISPDGKEHFIGSAEIPDLSIAEQRRFSRNTGAREETFKCTIEVTSLDAATREISTVSQVWRICHAVRSTEETSTIISRHLGYNVGSMLSSDKLFSHIALAFPIGLPSGFNGRLFTLLPLPIHTGFPIHVHAILALTQDRQSLRNIEETGTGPESRERLLVTWNKSIFDIFLPATWSALLRVLVDQGELEDIWSAWPASTHGNTSGSSYWREILPELVEHVLGLNLPIFPTFPNANLHVSLSSAFIASEDDDTEVLLALSKVGLSIVKPPRHIQDALRLSSDTLRFLDPTSVRDALLVCGRISALNMATEDDKDRVLQYLVLAPGMISNAIGLPLVPLINGSRVSLHRFSTQNVKYVLVTQQEADVFGDCDNDLISLPKLSPRVAEVFCSPTASQTVNVTRLAKTKIQSYLYNLFGSFNPADDEVAGDSASSKVEWLTRFWKWMSNGDKSELLLLIKQFHLLPTAQGTLRKMDSRILLPIPGMNGSRTMNAWGILGVRFLHPNTVPFSSAFRSLAVDPGNIPFLISSISSQRVADLDAPSASLIQSHLVQSLRTQTGNSIRLDTPNHLKFLQAAHFSDSNLPKLSQRGTGAASGTLIFMRVGDDCPVPATPNHTTFFDVTPSSGVLGTILDAAGVKKALDELGVLEMAVDHLKAQPLDVLDALISRMIPRLLDLSASAKRKLQSVPFVTALGSTNRIPPAQIVDPRSELASLYSGEPGKLPSGRWSQEPSLSSLTSQGFFQRELTADILSERIAYLARSWPEDENPRLFAKARILLRLLDESRSWASIQHVFGIARCLQEKWLPIRADTVLVAPAECRDRREKPFLFDLCLSVVDAEVHDGPLRRALGWNGIPMPVLQDQLHRTLTHPTNRATRLHALITEYSRRFKLGQLVDEDIESLERVVAGHPWVPVERTHIVETKYALLRSSRLGGRFKTVPGSLLEAHGGHGALFLRQMGCAESPCLETLMTELALLNTEQTNLTRAVPALCEKALEILKEMAPMLRSCNQDNYARIFVPGKDEVLHPIRQVYFVDCKTDFLPETGFPVHPRMPESLARDLEVQFLSSLELGDDDDDDDLQMGEDFTTRVEGVLKEHDVEYALNEFLANAIDAKATTFSVLLDERTFESSKLLAPGLSDLQRRPALLLYNNAKFSDADFRGLRQVGQGGKRSNPDSIGRYGLGALSLFHFTDVVQIVSDGRLLILDPSGTHLMPRKGRTRTSLLKPLSDVFRRYPDQLSPFDSVHGFSKSAPSYSGTIFRLALRDNSSVLSSTVIRASDCLNYLNGPYFELARNAMYFTCLEHISAAQQPPVGRSTALWSVIASRPPTERTVEYETVSLKSRHGLSPESSQLWLVTKSTTPISRVPTEHSNVLMGMRLHESQVGLIVQMALLLEDKSESATALRPTSSQSSARNSSLFSTLRLPVQTSLPAHISAQFAISSDRRHIRFEPPDSSGHRLPQAAFNYWILDKLLPPLYISSIHHAANLSLSLGGRRARVPKKPFLWWPVEHNDDDSISRVIVRAFYNSALKTSVPICYSVTSALIAPVDAIFSTERTPFKVEELLSKLEISNFVALPFAIRKLAVEVSATAGAAGTEQLRFVDPSLLRDVLEPRSAAVVTLFRRSGVSIPMINAALLYMLRGAVAVSGLPLLVLADGTLTHGSLQQLTKYVCRGDIPDIFPRSHFLHETAEKELQDLLVQHPNTNVKLFDAAGVLALVKDRVPAQSRCIHSPETKQWIARFWETYSHLPGPPTPSSLDPLTLISTTNGDYISLEYCRRDDVITEPIGRPALVSAMQSMDLLFCQVPPPLRFSFDKPFTIQTFLKAIRSKSLPFDSLSSDEAREVCHWIRSEVHECRDTDSRNIVQSLPIWEARQNHGTVLLQASHLEMLPNGLRLDLFDGYTRPGIAIANFSHTLHTVLSWSYSYRTMTSEKLAQLLTFPDFLNPSTMDSYSRLLTAFLNLGGAGKIPVPDGNLRLRQIDELYDHSVQLFSAALQSSERTLFLHPSFRHLNQQLRSKNLHFQVNWDSFLFCATTVHGDLTTRQLPESEIMARAEVVYDFYNSRLPNIVMTNASRWRQLSGLRFIPRDEHRTTSSSYEADSYCEPLPEIVAPFQILRAVHEQVAWSQRALFRQEPMTNLIAVNPSLGVPTPEEVVKHLEVLALQVAPEHRGNGVVHFNQSLLQQICATYQWLVQNKEEARHHLLLRLTEPLFLNVDDPAAEPWEWRSAEQLMLNVEYDYDETFRVRRFLQDYRPLLLAAGVKSEEAVEYKPGLKPQDGNALRAEFDLMRRAGQLTDMLLMPSKMMGEDIDVESLRAHSMFLAAAIPHVRDALLGWREGSSTEYSFPGTYFGARAVLDFVYTGKMECDPGETGDGHMTLLRDLLELLCDADPWDMPELKDEIGRLVKEWKLLSRDTYWMITDEAERYQAASLRKYCKDWGETNPGSVGRREVYEEESGSESSEEDL
ncbi:hypothetical protein DFH09DRAFT_1044441 [Mycena vulgaris]|nr:hypothetical protein DFH09DRAFT_1044441 [Mycena vulgaris]